MRVRVLALAAVTAAVALGVPSPSPAQGLAEAAAKEKERRKTAKSGKVYTEEDLRRAGGRTANVMGDEDQAAGEAAPAASTEPAGEKPPAEKGPDEVRADQEKAWRDRLKKASDETTRLAQETDRLQASANDVSGNLYSTRRTELLNRLEEARKQLAAAQQSVADLEEEGRRNRYRP